MEKLVTVNGTQCGVCGGFHRELERHFRNRHPEVLFQVKRYKTENSSSTSVLCGTCGYWCGTFRGLVEHYQKTHDQEGKGPSISDLSPRLMLEAIGSVVSDCELQFEAVLRRMKMLEYEVIDLKVLNEALERERRVFSVKILELQQEIANRG